MDIRFNIIVKLVGDDVMDKKIILKTFEGLLIGKSAVGAKNNRYFLWKSCPDKSHDVSNLINIIGSVIWISAANPENHIDQVRAPTNMQGLKAFLFLVGDITKHEGKSPRPEILSFVTEIFVILVLIKDSVVVHLKSDEFLFV